MILSRVSFFIGAFFSFQVCTKKRPELFYRFKSVFLFACRIFKYDTHCPFLVQHLHCITHARRPAQVRDMQRMLTEAEAKSLPKKRLKRLRGARTVDLAFGLGGSVGVV